MIESLSSIFQKTKGSPIDVNGLMVRPSYRLNLQKGNHEFVIRRLTSKEKVLQGLRLKIKHGEILVNDQKLIDVILWSDTSPDVVNIIVKSKKDCELIIWNEWRIDGLDQAWIGNAGIHIIDKENKTILECSNGIGDINFSDFVVEIEKLT